MHAALQIHLVMKAIRGKLGARHQRDAPDVRDIHRFLTNACHMPEDKLEHPGFNGTDGKNPERSPVRKVGGVKRKFRFPREIDE